jgi:hypothetical protein
MHREAGEIVVVETGASELLVRQVKTQRRHQMEAAAGVGGELLCIVA